MRKVMCILAIVILSTSTAYAEYTIVAIGDSNTRCGKIWDTPPGHTNSIAGGWVTLLRTRLDEEFPGEYKVINKGINGDVAQGVFNRLASDVFAYSPDTVIVAIGANDASNLHWSNPPARTAGEFLDIMEKIIPKIRSELPNSDIVLVGIILFSSEHVKIYYRNLPHSSFDQQEYDTKIIEYNEVLRELSRKYSDVSYFDPMVVWPQDVKTRWDFLTDGLHPNDAGQTLLADALYEFLFGVAAVDLQRKFAVSWGEIKRTQNMYHR